MSKGRKTNIELINEAIWHKKIYPKNYVLSVSNEKLVITQEFINVNAADQLVTVISKTELPQKIILSHASSKVLNGCLDWLIKYCETFGKLMPDIEVKNVKVFDRIEEYDRLQAKANKRRRKKKLYT